MTVCCPSTRPLPVSRGLWQECSCAVLGGLLCSSCCVVQLLLNLFSIGCAGFATLTPYRPLFLSATTSTLLGNYLRYKNKRRTALAVAFAFGLAITPEIVQLYNKDQSPSLALLFRYLNYGKAHQMHGQDLWTLSVTGLRCQACSARLKRHILERQHVTDCSVDFEANQVQVRASLLQENDLVAFVQELGYDIASISRQRLIEEPVRMQIEDIPASEKGPL